MALNELEIRAIRSILMAIKRKLDLNLRNITHNSDLADDIARVGLQIEGIRSKLMIFPYKRPDYRPDIQIRIMRDVGYGLSLIAKNEGFMNYASQIKSSDVLGSTNQEDTLSITNDIIRSTSTLDDLIFTIWKMSDDFNPQTSLDFKHTSSEILNLANSIPSQKVGPVQFTIKNNRLSVAKQSFSPKDIDAGNVTEAKSEILRRGNELIQELKSSNNDPRLIAEIEKMNSRISDSKNVIEIGISNIGCGMLGVSLREELSPAVTAMIGTYNMSIDMYVAQFPDWNRFIEQAALAQIDENDVVKIRSAAENAIENLLSRPDIVDPTVPATFQSLVDLINSPARSSKRAIFAILRSLENLVSKTVSYAGDLLEKTARKTIDKLSSTLSSALVVGLLTIAVNASTGVAPIASKINELHWLKNAIEVLQNQLTRMRNGTE